MAKRKYSKQVIFTRCGKFLKFGKEKNSPKMFHLAHIIEVTRRQRAEQQNCGGGGQFKKFRRWTFQHSHTHRHI